VASRRAARGPGLLLKLIHYSALRLNPTLPFRRSRKHTYFSHYSTTFSKVLTFSPCTDKLQRAGKRMGYGDKESNTGKALTSPKIYHQKNLLQSHPFTQGR